MATQQKMQSGANGRTEGFDFEDLLEEIFNATGHSGLKIVPAKQMVEGIVAKTARNKNDKVIESASPADGLSIKNPKTSGTPIQMQIILKKKLLARLGMIEPVPQGVLDFFDLFFGTPDTDKFREDCARLGVNYDALEYQHERRRNRALWDSIPKKLSNAFLKYFNKEEIKREILEVVLKRGVTALRGSEFMIWCDSSVAGKSNPAHLAAFRIDTLIDQIISAKFKWTPKLHQGRRSTVYLGPLGLQMKGSGSGQDYHNPQFRMSLNSAIRECPSVPVFRGDYRTIFPSLENLPK